MDNTPGARNSAGGAFAHHATGTEVQVAQKRLIILRHGDPDNLELLKAQVSHANEQLYRAYPDLEIDAILYSPLKRTVATAGQFYRLHLDQELKGIGLILPFQKQEWLAENSGSKIGYDGLLEQVRALDNDWDTVVLVTHSTTGPHIAKALKTDADDMHIVTSMFDLASVLVLDLPVNDWKKAGIEPTNLALTIGQPKPDTNEHSTSAADTQAPPEDLVTPS